jgi:cytochrome c6
VFRSAGCANCHTLASADAHGQIGPNLDRLKPGYERVRLQVQNGGSSMPSFKGQLTPVQIRNVAAYVAA